MTETIAVLGLGEAGSLIATGLVRAGAVVRGFDPKVTAPAGVVDCPSAAEACRGAGLVLSVNSAIDALDALTQGLPGCAPETIWAELNTAAPARKQEIAHAAGDRVHVVDVALMMPVPPRGLQTPMTVSGPAAARFAATMRRFGADIDVLSGPVGEAATRKLLRSVFYKGLAAAVVEAMTAAHQVGLADWLRENITEELVRADESTVERLLVGSRVHAARRTHEMDAAVALLQGLGVPPRISQASRDWLEQLATEPTA